MTAGLPGPVGPVGPVGTGGTAGPGEPGGPGSPGGTALERTLAVALAAAGAEPVAPPPTRSRGTIGLLEENCTVCMLCARECPDWCVYIESHKEAVEVPGGRPRQRNVLDRFAIDFSLCMYCGICVEVCPFDALFWSPEYEYSTGDPAELTHERDRLRDWMRTVPPPEPLDA